MFVTPYPRTQFSLRAAVEWHDGIMLRLHSHNLWLALAKPFACNSIIQIRCMAHLARVGVRLSCRPQPFQQPQRQVAPRCAQRPLAVSGGVPRLPGVLLLLLGGGCQKCLEGGQSARSESLSRPVLEASLSLQMLSFIQLQAPLLLLLLLQPMLLWLPPLLIMIQLLLLISLLLVLLQERTPRAGTMQWLQRHRRACGTHAPNCT